MNRREIENEMRRRAAMFLSRDRLFVDYYRIRRKAAYPLPVRRLHILQWPAGDIRGYPWSIWLLWALEERLDCLGQAAMWFDDAAAKETAARELAALAEWPSYRQYGQPDLSLGHAARLLWTAYTQWSWPADELREKIAASLQRLFDDARPLADKLYGAFKSKEDILALPKPHEALHNIPLIGTVGAALAAHATGREEASILDERLSALVGALLDARRDGFSEGAAYDGYVMDFIAAWLSCLPKDRRAPFLEHPRFEDALEQSYHLAAPGTAEQLAELGDVEPERMPFHLSAQAKLQHLKPEPRRAWFLQRCRPSRLRADALAALHPLANEPGGSPPPAGASAAHYAVVLRSGWEADDLAVAVSAADSPMGHLHHDYGSLVVGTRGRWLITDPGYQQYMQKTERAFTLGPTAHNAPVIDGRAQTRKAGKRLFLGPDGVETYRVELDLSGCYEPGPQPLSVRRTVWLSGRSLVVVADRLHGAAPFEVLYHWHGRPEAAWWIEVGRAVVCDSEAVLWISSPQASLAEKCLDRLPGSRGHLTLTAALAPAPPVVWWVFATGTTFMETRLADEYRLCVGDRRFEVAP